MCTRIDLLRAMRMGDWVGSMHLLGLAAMPARARVLCDGVYIFFLFQVFFFLKPKLGIFPPALRYGIASRVMVSLPAPGEPAVLVMDDREISVSPAPFGKVAPQQQAHRRVAEFRSPPERFKNLVAAWAALALLWVAIVIVQTVLDGARIRAHPVDRCWVTNPGTPVYIVLATINPPFAASLIVALAAIIATQGLGGCAPSWMKFWYRRNWIFVLLTFLRAFVFIRPQISLAKWIGSFVNYAVFLCIILSVPDLILLLQPRKGFIVMYYLFIAVKKKNESFFSWLCCPCGGREWPPPGRQILPKTLYH